VTLILLSHIALGKEVRIKMLMGYCDSIFQRQWKLIDVAIKAVFRAVHKLNSRPKKCLGYTPPYEAFEELTGVDIKNLLGYALA
jgi:hypothetical protein